MKTLRMEGGGSVISLRNHSCRQHSPHVCQHGDTASAGWLSNNGPLHAPSRCVHSIAGHVARGAAVKMLSSDIVCFEWAVDEINQGSLCS